MHKDSILYEEKGDEYGSSKLKRLRFSFYCPHCSGTYTNWSEHDCPSPSRPANYVDTQIYGKRKRRSENIESRKIEALRKQFLSRKQHRIRKDLEGDPICGCGKDLSGNSEGFFDFGIKCSNCYRKLNFEKPRVNLLKETFKDYIQCLKESKKQLKTLR